MQNLRKPLSQIPLINWRKTRLRLRIESEKKEVKLYLENNSALVILISGYKKKLATRKHV